MMKKTTLALVLLSSSSLVWAKDIKRGYAEFINEKSWSFDLGVNLFGTGGYYDEYAEEQSLGEGQAYSMLDVDLKATYGFNNKFQISGLTKFRKVESQSSEELVESATGVESAGIEARYLIYKKDKLKFAVGAHYIHSLVKENEEVSPSTDGLDLAIGDPGGNYGASVYMTYNPHPFKINGSLGYRSPGSNLNPELVYNLEGMYSFNSFAVALGVDGLKSLAKEDETGSFTGAAINTGRITHYFNSPNREWLNVYGAIHVPWKNWIFSGKAMQTMAGNSTDKFTMFGLGVTYETPGISSSDKAVESFKEYAIEASVLKVTTKGNFVRIDQGLSTDVEKGMRFDIYQTDYYGGNVLVATGVVYEVGADSAVIKLTRKHKDIVIKAGFVARGY